MIELGFLGENASSVQLIVVDVQSDDIRVRERRDVTRRSTNPAADVLKHDCTQ